MTRLGPDRASVRPAARRRPRWHGLHGLLLALALAACTPAPPAPPAESALPLPPPPPPAARPVARAAWTFQRLPKECRATARAGRFSLTVLARDSHPILLILAPAPHRRLELRFAGPAGTWAIEATAPPGHPAAASFGPGDTGLSRLLIMLSGGTLSPQPPAARLPPIGLPPSGPEGTRWFDCVRNIRS